MKFRARQQAEKPSFQIAPMIDVIFLLLCFFVSSQLFSQWETEIEVKLPTAESGDMPNRLPGEIIINVLRDGTTIVNGRKLDDAGLLDLLGRVVKLFKEQAVVIRADEKTTYDHVVKVLDLCRQADVFNISFATSFEREE